jgi:hypothetical protein
MKKKIKTFAIIVTTVAFALINIKIIPFLYTLGLKNHPPIEASFTASGGVTVTPAFESGHFSIPANTVRSIIKADDDPSFKRYVIQVTEDGQDMFIAYTPTVYEKDKNGSHRVMWQTGQHLLETLFYIVFCEMLFSFFLLAAIHIRLKEPIC